MSKICPQCSAELKFKEGFSKKNGKPWKAYMCPVRECGYVEWLKPGQQSEPKDYQTKPTSTDFILDKLASLENILVGILRAVEKNAPNELNNAGPEGTDAPVSSR